MLDAFEDEASGRESIVLLTADHGESIGEDDFWFAHGHTTLPPLSHVPFVLRAPGIPTGRSDAVVSHVDVLPTLLDLAGLPADTEASGIALAPILREGGAPPERFVYSDIGPEVSAYDDDGFIRITGVADTWQPENSRSDDPRELWLHYDWKPGTPWRLQRGRSNRPTEIVTYLDEAEPMSRTPALELDDIERLRALGYGGEE